MHRPRASSSPNQMQPYLLSFVNPLSDWRRAYGAAKHTCQSFVLCFIQAYAQGIKETP